MLEPFQIIFLMNFYCNDNCSKLLSLSNKDKQTNKHLKTNPYYHVVVSA